jgi:hypothetical protein
VKNSHFPALPFGAGNANLCGFNQASKFTHYYSLRFGEHASVTLARNA